MKMIKKGIFTIFFVLLLCIMPAVSAFAAGDMPRLVDEADLIPDGDEAELLGKLDEISERQQVDVVVLTVNSLEGMSPEEYADDFYDYNGYGFGDGRDGILFLISMGEREMCMSTTGYGITAFTDAGQDYIYDQIMTYIKDGDYTTAFTIFATQCDGFITQARTGEAYDVDNLPQGPFSFFGALIIAVGIGFIVSLIATGIMRLQLHSVYSQSAADSYMIKDSLKVTRSNDLFLYRQVERREKPKEEEQEKTSSQGGSTTHVSSSGTTHGGSSRKF